MASGTDNWNDVPDNMFDITTRGSLRSNRLRPPANAQAPPQLSAQEISSRFSSNSQQPRRKSSQQSYNGASRQPLGERNIEQSSTSVIGGIFDLQPSKDRSAEALHPLRAVADRVGREVEEFAEKLDRWKEDLVLHEAPTKSQRSFAAIELVEKFKDIAERNVRSLQKIHAAGLRKRVKAEFAEQYKPPVVQQGEAAKKDPDDSTSLDQVKTAVPTTVEDLEYWQSERDTWRLYEALLQVRSHSEDTSTLPKTTIPLISDNDRFAADGQVWKSFLADNPEAQERVIVLKWLEQTAEKTGVDLDLMEQRLETSSRSGHGMWVKGWLNTREILKQEKRLRLVDIPLDGDRPSIATRHDASKNLVTQLDPDAPTRLGRSLELPDDILEEATWLVCWQMLRRGYTNDEIRQWCHDHYDFGKVYMLGVYPASQQHSDEEKAIRTRWAWRIACLAAARGGGVNDSERAAFGLLAGDERSVQKVCKTWEDQLFGLANHVLLHDYRQYMLAQHADIIAGLQGYDLDSDSHTASSLKAGSSIYGIMKSLHGSQIEVDSARSATAKPLQIIQSSLVSKDLGSLVYAQGLAIARQHSGNAGQGLDELVPEELLQSLSEITTDGSVAEGDNALRVLAHILIIEQNLDAKFGLPEQEQAADLVIVNYINYLLMAGKLMLIPLYISLLPRRKAPKIMARVLAKFPNDEQKRDEYAKLLRAEKVDLLSALKFQYQLALANSSLQAHQQPRQIVNPRLLQTVSDSAWPGYAPIRDIEARTQADEDEIIQACQWFGFIEGCWMQTFAVLKDAVFRFLREGRTHAAIDLTCKISGRETSLKKTEAMLGKRIDLLAHDSKNQYDDSLAFQAMRAHAKVYYDTAHLMAVLLACSEYRKIADVRVSSATMSKIEIADHQALLVGKLDMLRILMPQVLSDRQFLQQTLSDPTGGEESEMVEVVRTVYLPEAILAYISVLYRAGREEGLRECIEVAKVVAEREELQKCFTATSRMRELVVVVALCNKKLLQLSEEQKGRKKGRVNRRQSLSAGWHK